MNAIDLIRRLGRSPKFADIVKTGRMNTLANELMHLSREQEQQIRECGKCVLCDRIGPDKLTGRCCCVPTRICPVNAAQLFHWGDKSLANINITTDEDLR